MTEAPYHGPVGIDQLVTWLQGRPKRNLHAILLVNGEPGMGKSGLALQLGRAVQGPSFNPQRQIVLSFTELEAASRNLPRGSVIIVDEAILAGGNKRRGLTKDNVANMDYLNTTRKRGHIVIYIVPHYEDADKSIRDHAHWVLDVVSRGRVVAFEPIKGGVKKLAIFLEPRFEDVFPNCEEALPRTWASYLERIEGHLAGDESKTNPERERRVHSFRSIVRRYLA